jgi:hypothetical protein
MSPPRNRDVCCGSAQLAGIPKPFTALNNTRPFAARKKRKKGSCVGQNTVLYALLWRRRTAGVRDRGAALNPILRVAQEEHIKDVQPNTYTQDSGVGESGTYAGAALARSDDCSR